MNIYWLNQLALHNLSTEYNVFLGLGSNQGNKLKNLKKAIKSLSKHPQIKIEKVSSIYESKAIGLNEEKPSNFLNAVCKLSSSLIPEKLLEICQNLENKFGRIRQKGLINSRPLDLDILFYDNLIIQTNKLCIPHPQALKRDFVLIPLQEIIDENWQDPISGLNYAEIYKNLEIFSDLKKITTFEK